MVFPPKHVERAIGNVGTRREKKSGSALLFPRLATLDSDLERKEDQQAKQIKSSTRMVKISDKIRKAEREGRPWWSFEFFPYAAPSTRHYSCTQTRIGSELTPP